MTVTIDDCEPDGASSVVVGGAVSSVTVVGAESVVLPAASVARATTVYCAPFVRRREIPRARRKAGRRDAGESIAVPAANEQLPPAQ